MAGIIEQACEIIEATQDGDKLHPRDLKLVENAVNGFLNDAGLAAFAELHAKVTRGEYVSPFDAPYFGIEGLSIDPTGYVYWRGVRIDHYTPGWCWTEAARAQAQDLAARCLRYEAAGLAIRPGIVWEADPTLEEVKG